MAHSGAQHFVQDNWGFVGGLGSHDMTDMGPESTEWEDALVKHKIISKRTKVKTVDQMNTEWREEQEQIDELADKTLDELDELEEELDEDTLIAYRRHRIAEMQAAQESAKWGTITQISEPEFVPVVSDGSKGGWVICCLFASGTKSTYMLQCLANVAARHPEVRFVKIVGRECIRNYPDRYCPTLLVYKDGDAAGHIKGDFAFGGKSMTADTIEWHLSTQNPTLGCWESDQDDDPFERFSRLHKITGKNYRDNLNQQLEEDSDSLDL